MKQNLKDIQHGLIYRGRNVRLPGLAHENELYEDIKANGLKKQLLVFQVSDLYEVIQGHLRSTALDRLKTEEPARFEELFPSGTLSCLVLSDCTYDQAQLEKLDHGQENPLMNPMEVQLSMNFLLDAGCTESQIATQLAGLMNRVSPMKAKKKKEYDQLLRDIELYRSQGQLADIAEKERQAAQLLLDYRKGKIQNCKGVWSCPHIVMAAMWYKATGGERNWGDQLDVDIADDVYLPSVLQVDTVRKKLATAFANDLKIEEPDGTCRYNKRVPGPNFNSEWDSICSKSRDKEDAPEIVREKAYSKGDLEDDEKKWTSTGFRMLTQHHRRKPGIDPSKLVVLDKVAYFAEILADRAPDAWTEALELARGLEKEIIAENKEVEAKAAAAPAEKLAADVAADVAAVAPPTATETVKAETPAKVLKAAPKSKKQIKADKKKAAAGK